MRTVGTCWVTLAVAACAASAAQAQSLNPGDPAPPFSLPGTDGRTHNLADYQGKTVILAWFPKAFTGG